MAMFGKADNEQFPHVRAMTVCLACGRKKDVGLLVCWPCNNELKIVHDIGYGPDVDRVIAAAQSWGEAHDRINSILGLKPDDGNVG